MFAKTEIVDNDRCPQCGLNYVHGLPEDEREHRRWHRRWAAVAHPKPNPRVEKLATTNGLITVDQKSPRWLNRAVYERARVFRREFECDFDGWDERGPGVGPDEARAFLFIADDKATIAGACAFWRVEWQNAPDGWVLGWVWLATAFRRQGILTRHWPTFIRTFGPEFYLEQLLSDAMKALARKHNHISPKTYPSSDY